LLGRAGISKIAREVVLANRQRGPKPACVNAVEYALRRVTRLPLTELWNAEGPVFGHVLREDLTAEDIKRLLRAGPVQFVEIVPSEVPHWIPAEERFAFWKDRLEPRLAQFGPENRIYTDDLPVYVASEWAVEGIDLRVVVAVLYD
jgi:hypothetical protein